MMLIDDLRVLAYLHDATVFELIYDAKDTAERTVILSVECQPDAGYPAWDGKRLRIRLENTVLVSFLAHGDVVGAETIDDWRTTVSASIESEIRQLHGRGVCRNGVRFVVTFHSGSILEGLCNRITVD